MKHIITRGNKYYYKRRIPVDISHLVDVKLINRPLSTDKKLSQQLAKRYDNIFMMITLPVFSLAPQPPAHIPKLIVPLRLSEECFRLLHC